MKLYYSKGACSLAVRIIIHEIGLNCEFEAVDLKAKTTETGADFNQINPKGSVPTLQLDNDSILTENFVIQQYLADENKAINLLPSLGDFTRYRVLEWSNYISTELHKGCSPLFNPTIPQELKDSIFLPQLQKKLQYVNQHLSDKEFLIGKQLTLSDAYLFVILRWTDKLKNSLSDCPNLIRYKDNLRQRPAFQQSLQEEGL